MSNEAHPPAFQAPTIAELQPYFPNYTLEELLAQGGMGAVYRAHQTNLDRLVAIKILPRHLGTDAKFRESFAAEAKAMARLNHPNLISVFDFGDADGMLFIVMEYVAGESLHYAAGQMPVEPAKAVELTAAICRGLAHAHENGLVHGDIKPANILLDAKRRPKIGDFGLTRQIGEQSGEDDTIFGTPGYTAPEVTEGGPTNQRADIYSVGALLYRLLTGIEPDHTPLPPVSTACRCPKALHTIIARAMHPDPLRRSDDAGALANSLEQSTRSVPLQAPARPQSVPAAIPVPVIPPARRATPITARKLPSGIGAVLVLVPLAIGATILYKKLNTPEIPGAPEPYAEVATPIRTLPSPRTQAAPRRTVASAQSDEPPAKALTRLRRDLARGERTEFPPGTAARDGSHFLVLPELLLSWPEAQRFAEEHGAHLAILPSKEDQHWLQKHFKFERPLWLGAALGARDQWQWIDASPWSGEDRFPANSSSHRRIALSSTGGLFPARTSQPHAVALQWRDDGSNPATPEAQLGRTAESATAEDLERIVYPIGTFTREDSHYFYYDKELSWDEARKFAKSLGAYLAVPSSPEEHRWIKAHFSETLAEDKMIWLGGFRLKPGARWQWLSGEAWNNSGWKLDEHREVPAYDRLALHGSSGSGNAHWVAAEGSQGKAKGLLCEWSPPRKQVQVANFELKPWLKEVNRKIGNSVESDLDEFAEHRKGLVNDYQRAMNRILRRDEDSEPAGRRGPGGFRFPGGNRRMVAEIRDNLKAAAEAGELMSSLPDGASKKLREQQAASKTGLKLLEETYEQRLNGHLTYYINGVRKKSDDLAQTGCLADAQELRKVIAPINGDTFAFVGMLFEGTPRAVLPWTPEGAVPDDEDEGPDDNDAF